MRGCLDSLSIFILTNIVFSGIIKKREGVKDMNEGGGPAFKLDIQHRGDIDHKVAVGV